MFEENLIHTGYSLSLRWLSFNNVPCLIRNPTHSFSVSTFLETNHVWLFIGIHPIPCSIYICVIGNWFYTMGYRLLLNRNVVHGKLTTFICFQVCSVHTFYRPLRNRVRHFQLSLPLPPISSIWVSSLVSETTSVGKYSKFELYI